MSRRPSILPLAILILVGLLSTLRADTSESDRERPADVRVFQQAWDLVRRNFVDRRMNGVHWATMRVKYGKLAVEAKTQSELHDIIIAMLGELKASHLTLVEEDVFDEHIKAELANQRVPTFGLELVMRREGLFIAAVVDGSAAHLADLRRGDRILTIDKVEPATSPRLRPAGSDPGLGGPVGYVISPHGPVRLHIERRPEAGEKGVFITTLRPYRWNMVAGSSYSTRVLDVRGTKLGYMHLWHLGNVRIVSDLENAMLSDFAECDGLVLDLRGRGGTPDNVQLVLRLLRTNQPFGPRWSRPTVALIDSGSRSAKEVLAFHLKRLDHVTLVGERTAGAVLGARFFKLLDNSQLMIPTTDMRTLSYGISLEGKGVGPDIEVKDKLPWADGRDPILDQGVETLYWSLRERLKERCRSGCY